MAKDTCGGDGVVEGGAAEGKGKGGKVARLKAAEAVFGDVLDFRGFMLTPVNEMGVVCLFGAVAGELGFRIESFRRTFPDLQASRLVEPEGGRWLPCRIEFEFQSRNFFCHRHDPKRVDLIVCWEHNWDDAPVDVLELRRAVAALKVGTFWNVLGTKGERAGYYVGAGVAAGVTPAEKMRRVRWLKKEAYRWDCQTVPEWRAEMERMGRVVRARGEVA